MGAETGKPNRLLDRSSVKPTDAAAHRRMIELQNVTKYFGDFPAITDISFTVERGERVGFLGPNGAGKSTTMKIVTGFMPPSEGRLRWQAMT